MVSALRLRHGHGHRTRRARAHLRAVLQHQTGKQGHRTGLERGPWRGAPARRLHPDYEPGGTGNAFRRLLTACPRRLWRRCPRRPRTRRVGDTKGSSWSTTRSPCCGSRHERSSVRATGCTQPPTRAGARAVPRASFRYRPGPDGSRHAQGEWARTDAGDQELGSDVPFLFSSGYSDGGVHRGFVLDEGIRLLAKPYQLDELKRKVREALDLA